MKIKIEMENAPLWAKKSLLDSFRWIPEIDLKGLNESRVLAKISDLVSEPPPWQKECEKEGFVVSAVYSPKNSTTPAFIAFFVEAMYFPLEMVPCFPPITTFYFSHIVAHEVGHHLVSERGFIFTSDEKYGSAAYEEEMANRYAFEVVQRMRAKWYYRLADRVLKYLSKVHFEEGRQHWLSKHYAGAASSWYKAWLLDLNNETAGDLYWRAKRASAAGEGPDD